MKYKIIVPVNEKVTRYYIVNFPKQAGFPDSFQRAFKDALRSMRLAQGGVSLSTRNGERLSSTVIMPDDVLLEFMDVLNYADWSQDHLLANLSISVTSYDVDLEIYSDGVITVQDGKRLFCGETLGIVRFNTQTKLITFLTSPRNLLHDPACNFALKFLEALEALIDSCLYPNLTLVETNVTFTAVKNVYTPENVILPHSRGAASCQPRQKTFTQKLQERFKKS